MRRVLRVCEAIIIIGVTFCAWPLSLSAQNFGERIDISTLTFPTDKPTALNNQGTATAIWAYLKLPSGPGERFPAVILAHGCGGIQANISGWVAELTQMGIATFVLDSFTGRGAKTCTEAGLLSFASRLVDVYRALGTLATRPQIDPQRIALMGFSHGAMVTLYAPEMKFQRAWMPPGGYQFAAYLAFYPGCFLRLDHEELVVDQPIRIYHGSADDLTPLHQCLRYVDRMRAVGKDVQLTVYPGAYHDFDWPVPVDWLPSGQSFRFCNATEQADGAWVFEPGAGPCPSTGAHLGGNPDALHEAVRDVAAFLRQVFKLGQ